MKPNVRRLLSGNAGPTDSSARDVVMGCVRWWVLAWAEIEAAIRLEA